MKNPDIPVTDDCGLIVKYNLASVYVVQGEEKYKDYLSGRCFYGR